MRERRIDRAFVIVMDGCGAGEMPDAAAFGDAGSDTLGNLSRAVGGLSLPNFRALGLGNLTRIEGVPPAERAEGAFGRMAEASGAKDTTTGHWEMCGLVTTHPYATFPKGFPRELIDAFSRGAGRGVLGNKAASGTVIPDELGKEHLATGQLIVYTSADSVFQIAAHENVVPVKELYRICTMARGLCDPYRIARVIARPFVGAPGAFRRTYDRKDFAMLPPAPTLLDRLAEAGVPAIGIGKIGDIFSMRGLRENVHTEGNADGIARTIDLAKKALAVPAMVFTNLVDFDMLYGHRNDAPGYARALAEMDGHLPGLRAALGPRDVVLVTADHGCDPTTPSTDHSREHVPLLVFGPPVHPGVALGTRKTFADLGETLADLFGIGSLGSGSSFAGAVVS